MSYLAIYTERRKGNPDRGYTYLKDSKLGWKKMKYKSPVYISDEDGDYTTLFGEKCSKIEGKYDYFNSQIFEKDIQSEIGILRDFYYKTDDQPKNHNIVYIDIEIKILGALTPGYIQLAPAPLTSIALYDINSKTYICFIVDEENRLQDIIQENKQVITCYSEKDLINKFLKKWRELDPTIMITYNGDFFDTPYLYYRIFKVFGEETANLLSPIKKVTVNPQTPDKPIQIGGINNLDYMRLLKKFITKEEPSYTLNNIGIKYAGLGKLEYSGNLDNLLKTDPNKYVDYNIRDIEILKELESKQNFIQLTVLISHLCHTPYESIYYNTILNEGAILTYLRRKNIVVHNKPTTINKEIKELNVGDIVINQRNTPSIEGEIHSIDDTLIVVKTKSNQFKEREIRTIRKVQSYAGGFLLDSVPGLYKWLADYDYASLYPSIIRSLNLGIETLIGRIVIDNPTRNIWWGLSDLKNKDPKQEIGFETLDLNTYILNTRKTTIGKLIKAIEKNEWIISANGVIFDSKKKSIVSEILADWFVMRKEYKKKMEEAYKSGDDVGGVLNDQNQQIFKILLNAVYGAFAINGWRFTDGYKILSSAITCTGQRFLNQTLLYANQIIDEKYMK